MFSLYRKEGGKRSGSPPANPTSTGLTVPGIHPIPTRTGSTKARPGNPRKSIWTTVAAWFSNPAEDPGQTRRKTAAERILGTAVRRANLALIENCDKISLFCQIPASSGAFFLSAFQLYPDSRFPCPPVRLNGSFRSLPQKNSYSPRRKQIPSSQPYVAQNNPFHLTCIFRNRRIFPRENHRLSP